MSSACVCHTDEWCFYCNMYSPLEKEHSRLKGEIQRVIDSLEFEQKIAESRLKEDDHSHLSIGYWNAINDKCGDIINRFKELIPK